MLGGVGGGREIIWVGLGWVLELVCDGLGVLAVPALDARVELGTGECRFGGCELW